MVDGLSFTITFLDQFYNDLTRSNRPKVKGCLRNGELTVRAFLIAASGSELILALTAHQSSVHGYINLLPGHICSAEPCLYSIFAKFTLLFWLSGEASFFANR